MLAEILKSGKSGGATLSRPRHRPYSGNIDAILILGREIRSENRWNPTLTTRDEQGRKEKEDGQVLPEPCLPSNARIHDLT
jgi:hypothetical protein